ncbi:proline iminopeptidase [Granulicella aggregans]|uniref:Proline iminopeptidase n=2 Tax=Granulicella aggregans TaxID=474949 RepID=A0A7W7ZIH9_9BACT|nr:proline iminopeptidase [Granulicella aggregans]
MKRRNFLSLSTMAVATVVTSPMIAAPTDPKLKMPSPGTVHIGGSKRIQIGQGHWVWTKKVGSGEIKVLLVHGGPGADHRYFECFEDFLPLNGIEFYYYDQLDSTNSDKPNDPKLWTIERYTEEVEAVRQGLGLEQFYMLGHSWGGVLAIEYALKYQQHLKGLVISNMAASSDSFLYHVSKIRAQFPESDRAELERYENANETEDPAYQKLLLNKLYKVFICRLDPWPDPVSRSLDGWNQHVYNAIQGRNEFEVTGTMKGWDRLADLHKIKVHSLTIGARYDEMDPEDMRKMATLMPRGQSWISETGSHFAMYDDQQNYFNAVLKFLKA